MPTSTVRLHRVLRATPERVYKAFLDADAMSKWLPPHGYTGRVHHLLADVSDDDLRGEIDPFGAGKSSRGSFLVTQVLCGCAAYRTQLFLYLKACGREELNTWNLWVGVDEPQNG